MEINETNGLYDFGGFRLDAKNRLLYSADNGEPVALTLKEFEILYFFVKNAAQVVKKDDLLDAVWKDTFVEEGTLTRNISRLRKKLGEANEDADKFIETLPKRGYRFLPQVVKSNENALVIEEQTQMRVRIEETISEVIDAETRGRGDAEKKILALPNVPASPRLRVPVSLLLAFGFLTIAAIGFLVWNAYFRQTAPETITVTKITPFSGATGRENTPAFSPDGKQIAFAWNGGEDGGNSNIYVRLVGAAEPVRLTDNEFNEQYPIFSPDGNSIAFVRSFPDHGEVILIPALGGAQRRVARLFSGFASISFAPDGQSIAVIDTENSKDGGQYAVYVINLQTGERRRVTDPGDFAGETTPRFSPDGKSLAFVRVFTDKNQDLFVVSTSGGEAEQITFDKTIIHSLAWDADGRNIFFVSYRGGTQPNVWRVSVGGGEAAEVAATSGRDITNVAVAPDGKTLAFVENTRNTDIWSVSANQPSPKKFAASVYSEQDASFSPDGLRVVFASNRTGKYAIWLADADGKNLRMLNDSLFKVTSPHFSPDGLRVVFGGTSDENADIFVVSAEGGAPRRLTENAGRNFAPTWSADGTEIYFTSNRTGEFQIWKIPASGGEAVQITQKGAFEAFAAPDGKTVFYTKKQSNTTELWQVPANGGAEQYLPEFARAGFTGSWTMTQKGIYFLARDSEQFLKIMFYDFADKKIKDAAENYKMPENIFGNLDAANDGGVFLYSLLDQNASSIMLAELK